MPANDYLRYDILDSIRLQCSQLSFFSKNITFNVGKIKTIGAGVEKVKISTNPDRFITKLFFAI